MSHKQILKNAQETANNLYKQYKGVDPEKANNYLGMWEAIVWVLYDIDGDLFEGIPQMKG